MFFFYNCVDLTKELNRRSGCLNIVYIGWTSSMGIGSHQYGSPAQYGLVLTAVLPISSPYLLLGLQGYWSNVYGCITAGFLKHQWINLLPTVSCNHETRVFCDSAIHSSFLFDPLPRSPVGHHVWQKWPKSRTGAQEAAPRPNQGGKKEKGGGEEEERGKEKSE